MAVSLGPIAKEDWSRSFEGLFATTYDARWIDRLNDAEQLRLLEDDWDGEGSVAPELKLVNAALEIAECLKDAGSQCPNRIHAGMNGTVFFEWFLPNGYFEIEVLQPESAELRWLATGSDVAEVMEVTPEEFCQSVAIR